MTDYRAFGECQKIILAAGEAFDITATTADGQLIKGIVPKTRYTFAHVLTLTDTVLAGVKITYDIGAGTYAITLVGQTQIVGVTKLTVTSGQIEVLFFT